MANAPPKIGRCIYCRATQYANSDPGRVLGEEHIIPRGLGGKRVLREASCLMHEKITTQVETKCIEHIVSHARHDLGIYGRRANRKARRAAAKQPATFIAVFGFAEAGLFSGAQPTDDIAGKVHVQQTTPDFSKRLSEHGARNLNFRHGGFHAIDFARMLAKIGHAYAVEQFGLDGFDPLALGLINGTTPMNTSLLIGGEPGAHPATAERHTLSHEWRAAPDGVEHLLVRIRLFSNLGMPANIAIVGRRAAAV